MATRVQGYSGWQIGLHWLIAALVLFQIVFGEVMEEAMEAIEDNEAIASGDQFLSGAHYWVGLGILALVVVRVVLRLRNGAPTPAENVALTDRLAQAVHGLFYVLLFMVPISGLLAYYQIADVGDVHTLAKPAFIVLVAIHAGAALWHQFVVRDNVLLRMLKPGA